MYIEFCKECDGTGNILGIDTTTPIEDEDKCKGCDGKGWILIGREG